jgi:hypothetical protein
MSITSVAGAALRSTTYAVSQLSSAPIATISAPLRPAEVPARVGQAPVPAISRSPALDDPENARLAPRSHPARLILAGRLVGMAALLVALALFAFGVPHPAAIFELTIFVGFG